MNDKKCIADGCSNEKLEVCFSCYEKEKWYHTHDTLGWKKKKNALLNRIDKLEAEKAELENTINGATTFKIAQKKTAERCAEIARLQEDHLACDCERPPGMMPSEAIRKEFGG